MMLRHTPGQFLLFIVDCLILLASLFLAFSLRNGEWVDIEYFYSVLPPFSLVVTATILVFFSYGLYDKPSLRLIRELNSRIFSTLVLSGLLAIILFYSLPALGVAPKTILFLYIIIASLFISIWRRYAYKFVLKYKKQTSAVIGSGKSFELLVDEITRNPHLGITIVSSVNLDTYNLANLTSALKTTRPDSIIVDIRDERIRPYYTSMYELLFNGTAVVDIVDVYEDIFDMVPLSLINQEWVFRHINRSRRFDFAKRVVDICLAAPGFLFSLIFYPFIYLAIKIEDGGPVFYRHLRVGKFGKPFTILKFRSMEHKVTNELNETKKITRTGALLRKTRLDELPQLISVVKGELSLIGPRPESPNLVEEYNKSIPFYQVRHLVSPGLSGWAQIQQRGAPKFGVDIDQTSTKLSYDIYYLKHESLVLDLSIIVKTIKVLLSKSGI